MIDAARRLFLADGFAATTMPAVAAAAGVSVQTVYKVFGNKARLAKAVFDTTIAGDDEPVPMLERTHSPGSATNPTPTQCSSCTASSSRPSRPRHVPIQLVIRDAAATNPTPKRSGPNCKPNASAGCQSSPRPSTTEATSARTSRPRRPRRALDLQLRRDLRAPRHRTRMDSQQYGRSGRRRLSPRSSDTTPGADQMKAGGPW